MDQITQFIMTSPITLHSKAINCLNQSQKQKISFIPSGNVDGLVAQKHPRQNHRTLFKLVYVGTTSFAKFYPDITKMLLTCADEHRHLTILGDKTNKKKLIDQALQAGVPELYNFGGYYDKITDVLNQYDVFIYPLNPYHYGTSENTLLEAMALGLVPIVLDHPAERHIIEDQKTGFILKDPMDLGDCLRYLQNHPEHYQQMSNQAIRQMSQSKYHATQLIKNFEQCYQNTKKADKIKLDFKAIFGDQPAQWFCSFLDDPTIFKPNGEVNLMDDFSKYIYLDETKGSVQHFAECFPYDQTLKQWQKSIRAIK
ncbi:MAG: glycosyltransferase [Pseudomonadota bacterium]